MGISSLDISLGKSGISSLDISLGKSGISLVLSSIHDQEYYNISSCLGKIIMSISFGLNVSLDSVFKEYYEEFPKNQTMYDIVSDTLNEMLQLILPYLSQGWQGNEFSPNTLITTSSNLINIINMDLEMTHDLINDDSFGMRQDSMQQTMIALDQIVVYLFQTKVADEDSIHYNTGSLHCWGSRVFSEDVQPKYAGPWSTILFPTSTWLSSNELNGLEVFQYVSTFSTDPYQWTFADDFPITSTVAKTVFWDLDWNELKISNLPEHEQMVITLLHTSPSKTDLDPNASNLMNEINNTSNSSCVCSRNESQIGGSSMSTSYSLLPSEAKSIRLSLPDYITNVSGIVISLCAYAVHNGSDADSERQSFELEFFIGNNYIPHRYKYDELRRLILQLDADAHCFKSNIFIFLPLT